MAALVSPKSVFDLDPRIRWAALSTEHGEVLFSEMRPGVRSHTSPEVDRAFMKLGPLVMTGISERLTPAGEVGPVDNVIINFEKDSVLLKKTRHGHLALSVDRPNAAVALEAINNKIKALGF
jgi:hypothetical protein